jgi:hypothetical protein
MLGEAVRATPLLPLRALRQLFVILPPLGNDRDWGAKVAPLETQRETNSKPSPLLAGRRAASSRCRRASIARRVRSEVVAARSRADDIAQRIVRSRSNKARGSLGISGKVAYFGRLS